MLCIFIYSPQTYGTSCHELMVIVGVICVIAMVALLTTPDTVPEITMVLF